MVRTVLVIVEIACGVTEGKNRERARERVGSVWQERLMRQVENVGLEVERKAETGTETDAGRKREAAA